MKFISGESKLIEAITIGDEILVSTLDGKSFTYSPVVAIPHTANKQMAVFTLLSTITGRQLKVTTDHLVLGGECGSKFMLMKANDLKINDCIQTVSGEEVISTVATSHGQGVYTVVTKEDGLLVVNGVVASPFAVNHVMTNSFYNIHRLLFNFTPAIAQSKFTMSVIRVFGDIVLSLFSV